MKKRAKKTSQRILKVWKQKLWWIEVLYPIILGIFLFVSFTYVIYSDQKHNRLSSFAENSLLQLSLKLSALYLPEAEDEIQNKIFVFSVNDFLINAFSKSPSEKIRDLSIHGYAQLIKNIGRHEPATIIVSYNPAAHFGDDDYYDEFIEVLEKLPKTTKIVMAYPNDKAWFLPNKLAKLVTIMDDASCDDDKTTQILCPYNFQWANWMVQYLFNSLGGKIRTEKYFKVISESLPRTVPNYILNLKDPSRLHHLTWDEINWRKASADLKNGTVFIGNGIFQPKLGDKETNLIRRTFTVYDQPEAEKISSLGTPYHIFWAELADMLANQRFISVPIQKVTIIMSACFCLILVFCWYFLGGLAALAAFVIFCIFGPFVNALSLRYGSIYFPLFDTYFAGLVALIIFGFLMLSVSTLEKWRIEERRKIHVQTADLKSNFVSLLSHNLNTPIARMQGLLGVLGNLQTQQEERTVIYQAQKIVAKLEIFVRTILILANVEEGALHNVPLTVRVIKEEFQGLMGAVLRKLGVVITLFDSGDGEESGESIPLKFDPRVISGAISSVLVLLMRQKDSLIVGMEIYVDQRLSNQGDSNRSNIGDEVLKCKISCAETDISPEILKFMGNTGKFDLEPRNFSFFEEVMLKLIHSAGKVYQGTIQISVKSPGVDIILAFYQGN